jgi:hypothetical protein
VETRYDVSFGDIRDAQIVIGDHTTVVTPEGVKVVRIAGNARPELRPARSDARPAPSRPLVGRRDELELARRATPGWPLQLFGEEGIGKSSLLKHVAAGAPPGPVVYAVARRRSLDDLQAMLFRSFWEAEERFVPAPDEMPDYLGEREAIVILDDVSIDRDDLDVLLSTAPRCTFVLASSARTLWAGGASHELRGLSAEESVELIERELGRPLEGEERAAAVALAGERAGRPQSLVELAALVLERRSTLEQLAADVTSEPPAGAELSAVERRLLGVLGSLSGAALGTAHVGSLATADDAQALLEELERSGWVKSQSPRYRLARPVPAGAHEVPLATLVAHLAEWARAESTPPEAVAAESDAIEAVIERAMHDGRHGLAFDLARATESKLATSGLLGRWRRVLEAGLGASRAADGGDAAGEAYMLHQLGSLAIGVGGQEARDQLTAALAIRERLGDHKGAELTRHNLAQLGGPPGNGNGRGGPRRPRLGPLLGGLVVLGALGVGTALLVHGDDGKPARGNPTLGNPARSSIPGAPRPRPGHRPTIAVSVPAPGVSYEGAVPAHYVCRAARDALPVRCSGTVPGVGSVPDGGALPEAPGDYSLVVEARDRRGRTATASVPFEVTDPRKSPGNTSRAGPTGTTGNEPKPSPALPPPATTSTTPKLR